MQISIYAGELVLAICVDKPDDARRVVGDQVVG